MASGPSDGSWEPQDSEAEQRPSGSTTEETPIVTDRYEVLDSSGQPIERTAGRRIENKRGAPLSMIILAVCACVYLIFNVVLASRPEALIHLTFSPANGLVLPGLATHMFAHATAGHLLGNMLILFFLGTTVEQRYGTWRYCTLYFISGIVAALAQAVVQPAGFLLGASGALAGVMAAFVRHFPHVRLYIWAVLPMPAWLFIVLWLGYNLIGAGAGNMGVAFTAHLAGFAAGLSLSFALEPPRPRT
jgi:membrane associated rhomboid family serine protease